jgi:hypothetical protein
MKKRCNLTGHRVDPGQIRAFVKVAAMAGKREIVGAIGTAMLTRNDVFDVVEQITVPLAGMAVLAAFASPFADKSAHSCIHLLRDLVQTPPGLELKHGNKVRRVDQRFVLGPFVRIECAAVGLFSERIDPFLYWRINSKVNQASSGLSVEAAAQWVKKTVQPGCGTHGPTLARYSGARLISHARSSMKSCARVDRW